MSQIVTQKEEEKDWILFLYVDFHEHSLRQKLHYKRETGKDTKSILVDNQQVISCATSSNSIS